MIYIVYTVYTFQSEATSLPAKIERRHTVCPPRLTAPPFAKNYQQQKYLHMFKVQSTLTREGAAHIVSIRDVTVAVLRSLHERVAVVMLLSLRRHTS